MANKLYYKTLRISELSEQQIVDMFHVFRRYYNNVSEKQFKIDLNEKDAVFVLFDRKENKIRGFSTIVELNVNGHTGVFSGDTIIEKEFWGQGTLGVAFLKYLFMKKLRNPFKPLYWFLISKGFKTYLLMANNFSNHYPRFEREMDEHHKEIMDSFAGELYPEDYIADLGIISFKDKEKDSLKECIAPISQEMMDGNDRIRFFAQKNKNWQKGDELCCIAEMTLTMPLKYQYKIIKKALLPNSNSNPKKKKVVARPAALPIITGKQSL